MDKSEIDWNEPMTGGLIQVARRALGISKIEFSRRVGVSCSGITSIESRPDEKPHHAKAYHNIRVFFAAAGIDFRDGKVVVVHEWDANVEGRKYTPEQREEAHARFLKKYETVIARYIRGDTLQSIAEDELVSRQWVHQIAKKAGLPLRKPRRR